MLPSFVQQRLCFALRHHLFGFGNVCNGVEGLADAHGLRVGCIVEFMTRVNGVQQRQRLTCEHAVGTYPKLVRPAHALAFAMQQSGARHSLQRSKQGRLHFGVEQRHQVASGIEHSILHISHSHAIHVATLLHRQRGKCSGCGAQLHNHRLQACGAVDDVAHRHRFLCHNHSVHALRNHHAQRHAKRWNGVEIEPRQAFAAGVSRVVMVDGIVANGDVGAI